MPPQDVKKTKRQKKYQLYCSVGSSENNFRILEPFNEHFTSLPFLLVELQFK